MAAPDAPLVITLRDVYDSVSALGDKVEGRFDEVESWQEAHADNDNKNFNRLNIQFFGILAGLITVLAVVVKV